MNHQTHTPQIAVIIGSTRPTRICPGIAGWIQRRLAEHSTLDYQLLDLADVDLPLLDEPLKAALHDYRHDHTKAWSELISGFDGFVFVFPQYNWGYPAVLKNALDYLYAEWHGKAATTVTYGTRGGALAADQLHQVLTGLRMQPLDQRVEIEITDDQVDSSWQLRDLDATLETSRNQLTAIDAALRHALGSEPSLDQLQPHRGTVPAS